MNDAFHTCMHSYIARFDALLDSLHTASDVEEKQYSHIRTLNFAALTPLSEMQEPSLANTDTCPIQL